jgi:hypothetical protein
MEKIEKIEMIEMIEMMAILEMTPRLTPKLIRRVAGASSRSAGWRPSIQVAPNANIRRQSRISSLRLAFHRRSRR